MTWARKSPMKRSAFKTADRATSLRRSTIKQRTKKPTVAEGSKYLAACRGEECYLRVSGVCCSLGWSHESVVPCHSNQSRHGRGGAMKAEHQYTVPGCARCHEWIDRGAHGRQERFDVWDAAFELWLPVRERKMGLAEVECCA